MKSKKSKDCCLRKSLHSEKRLKERKKKFEAGTDFKNSSLSQSKQKYIETIYKLQGGLSNGAHAHVKDIAEELGIKMASVSGAARLLEKEKLITYHARRQISLTQDGVEMALQLNNKHKVLSLFFSKILGCEEGRAEYFACEIEHVIDNDIRMRIENLLKVFPIGEIKEKD